jgi:energy-coupling factor transporter transmembrane protein EcfT
MGHFHSTLGKLIPKDQILFDTKSKILLMLINITCLLFIISYEQLFLFFIYFLLLLVIYRINIRSLLLKLLIPLPLIVSLGLFAFLSFDDSVLLSFDVFKIMYSKYEVATFYVLRSLLLVLITLTLIESEESFFNIIYGLDDLKLPKVLINILLMMYRTSLDLENEGKRMLDVRYSRYPHKISPRSLDTFRILGYIIAGLLVRTLMRLHQKQEILISRGFNGTFYHDKINFTFEGVLLLWLGIILSLVILLSSGINFLNIGVRV